MSIDPRDIARHPFVTPIARALRRRCGIPRVRHDRPGPRLLVAVSGGADSVALLRALHALAPRRSWNLSLSVGHVQHHLRPDDQAEGDAEFVRDLSRRLGLPCDRADVAPASHPGNIERNARRLRYEALAAMAASRDAPFVVTAHHADDQLETVLMRMIRGTSVAGLRGIAWQRRLTPHCRVIRPMLAVTHEQALAFLRDLDQPWRDDATNRDVTRWRARLRRDVLPVLRSLRPDVPHQAVRLGSHFSDVQRLIDAEVDRARHFVAHQADRWIIPRKDARALNPTVLTALCRSLLREAGVPRDDLRLRLLNPIVRAIRDGAGGERHFHLPRGVRLSVTAPAVMITFLP